MRHAEKNRIGYSGFKCEKDAFLDSIRDFYKPVADEKAERGLNSTSPSEFLSGTDGTFNWLDNFYNIPIKYSGRVTVVEYLGGIANATDDNESDRRDIFSLAVLGGGELINIAKKLLNIAPPDEPALGPGYISLADFTNAFKEPQIQIDIASNKYEDGNLIAQVQQEKRNKRVDEQLNQINWSTVNNVIARMFETLHSMSLCPNFRISLYRGNILHQVSNSTDIPTFTIGEGRVYVRDNAVNIGEMPTKIAGSFDLGVKITLFDPSGDPFNYFQQFRAELVTGSAGSIVDSFSYSPQSTVIIRRLGGVYRVPFEFDGVSYYTYGIDRSPCDVHIPPYYVAKNGMLYAVAGGSTHYALSIYDCDEIAAQQQQQDAEPVP